MTEDNNQNFSMAERLTRRILVIIVESNGAELLRVLIFEHYLICQYIPASNTPYKVREREKERV